MLTKDQHSFHIRLLSCCLLVLSWSALSSTVGESSLPPTTTMQATSGMTHTVSAEPLGAGRLCFSLRGTWYGQEREFLGAPSQNTNIMTGLLGFSFGVNSAIDLFLTMPAYLLIRSGWESDYGSGSLTGGVQASLPLPPQSPFRLGAQFGIVAGTSSDQINTNRADGYNYFETRTGFDFQGRLMQSLLLGTENLGVKFHLNEGAVFSTESDRDNLLMGSFGVQGIFHPSVIFGIEINGRTSMSDQRFRSDPLWLTPSLQFRIPRHVTLVLGSDISLSQERSAVSSRALEPFRLFGGATFSFDALERRRIEAAERERKIAEEKAEARRQAEAERARADSLAAKARADSLALAEARERERQRADSLLQKAYEDSLALADAKKRLAEEMSKRSDAEKQLLSTGLLLLDAVYFETGKAEISINSRPYLNIIGKMLVKYPKLRIEVSGHTDNMGGFEANMRLSQNRAEAVMAYLLTVAPELSGRLTARGYGPSQPKADNTSADGRKVNRRVELQVLNKDVLREYNQ